MLKEMWQVPRCAENIGKRPLQEMRKVKAVSCIQQKTETDASEIVREEKRYFCRAEGLDNRAARRLGRRLGRVALGMYHQSSDSRQERDV